MVVVHPDNDFLEDITGKLKEYVMEEINVKNVTPCNDPLLYASLRAEPNFSVLGKRLGKDMGKISNVVKKMTQEEILAFEKSGEISFFGHCLKLDDIKVIRQFKRPENVSEKEIDAAGDGDVLVILDLRADQSLFEAGVAREVVNRIQKLRKTAQLEPSDPVDVYYESVGDDKNTLEEILKSQDQYIRDALGSPIVPKEMAPKDVVVLGEESHNVHDMSFIICIARSTPIISPELSHASGNSNHLEALRVYLLSRSLSRLKGQFQTGNGMITVDCIEGYPPIRLQLGKHVFLSAGDFYLASRS